MDAGLLAVLNESERLLVAETEAEALAGLAEDDAVALHTRVRRARAKYVGQYRRSAAARVPQQGARGRAHPKNTRSRQKAEVFELALARVSERVAVLAAEAAEQLKAERLAMARAAGWGGGGGDAAPPDGAVGRRRSVTDGRSGDRALRNPASEKRRAATTAGGARRQAARDSR